MSVLRLGLAGAALVLYELAFRLWVTAAPFRGPLEAMPCFAVWALGTGAAVLALVRAPRPGLRWLVLVVAVLSLWGHAWATFQVSAPLASDRPDDAMRAELSAQALRHGVNPYSQDYSDGPRVFRDRGRLLTRRLDGSPESRLTAPALPTLTLAALDMLGLGTPLILGVLSHTLLLVLVFRGAPVAWQPVVLFPLLAARDLAHSTLSGSGDVVWTTLLVGVALAWRRPRLAAILFGAAGAWAQPVWLALPFVSVWLLGRGVTRFISLAVVTFLAINLPFIVWGPEAWWLGVTAPLHGSLDLVSDGLGALSQYGLVGLPRRFYTLLQATSLIALVLIHWRCRATIGQAFWIFPAVVGWLSSRSVDGEWMFWLAPMIVALVRSGAEDRPPAPAGGPAWRLATAGGAVALAALILFGAWAWREPTLIGLASVTPLEVSNDGRVFGATVEVTNASTRTLAPRFAAQQTTSRPLPWTIVSGPETLAPGASARYVVQARRWVEAVTRQGGQLVLTDALGNNTVRTILAVPADPTLVNPDLPLNADFSRWLRDRGVPYGWELDGPTTARLTTLDGRTALALSARGAGPTVSARVAQRVTVPSRFAIWVRPPGAPVPGTRYGLELDDGRHVLHVGFVPTGTSPPSSLPKEDGRPRGSVVLAATPGVWSRHRIDVAALWAQRGWDLPPPSRRTVHGVQYATGQAWLSLVVSAPGREAEGVFGAIEVEPRPIREVVAAALERPAAYWLALGEDRYRQRNWAAARRAFERAVAADNRNADAYNAVGWSILAAGVADGHDLCFEAEIYFELARALEPSLPGPRRGLEHCR